MTNERNLGRAANYRRALYERMTGEWALMLDGDDMLIDPSYVGKAVEQITRDDKVVLAFGGCRMVSGDRYRDHLQTTLKGQSDFTPDKCWKVIDGRDYFLQWGVWLGVPHQSALYRRSLALQLDFYRHNIISSDWESLRRLILHGKVLIYRKAVAVWRRHSEGASNDVHIAARIADLASINDPYFYARSTQFLPLDRHALDVWHQNTLSDYAYDTYRVALEQDTIAKVNTLVHTLIDAIGIEDPVAAQRARKMLRQSPGLIIKKMMLRVLGAGRFHILMTKHKTLTWKRITS